MPRQRPAERNMDGIATDRFVAGADLPDARALREAAGLGGSGRDLIDAVLAADIARVRFLMERDPALAQTSSDGRSLAEVAVATGNAMLLREILSHGVDPDGAGDGAPLVLALHANGPELAYVLLAEHGAAPAPARGALEPVRAAIALGSAAGVRAGNAVGEGQAIAAVPRTLLAVGLAALAMGLCSLGLLLAPGPVVAL
ncbi:hypothetical protein LTR94_031015, partial [Friedmanniomyces endolithicus]